MKWVSFLSSMCLTALVWMGVSQRFGSVPALGPLLSPFHGVWVHSETDWSAWRRYRPFVIKELGSTVSIQIDEDRIPHIFAESAADLYFAQGWMTAKDRLWQMDFTARVGLGRLSEIYGPRTLATDRLFARMQLEESALKSWQAMQQDPATREALESYAQGVNAYIAALKPHQLPLEFKLLDYQPEPWTPLKSVLIIKLMTYRLSTHNEDVNLSRTALTLTPAQLEDLFPLQGPWNTPVVESLPAFQRSRPKAPEQPYRATAQELGVALPDTAQTRPGEGSNIWGLAKTRSGYPIIANDTHLSYGVPSLWYQVQLYNTEHNVYGVSIVGVPGVVIGHNTKLAWGATNGVVDVMDWFAVQFKDESRNEYWYDNQWVRTRKSTHLYQIRGQPPVEETLVSTHHGPVVYDGELNAPGQAPGLALRWIGHDATNELSAFLSLNRAQTVDQCFAALAKFGAPQQNFLCADSEKNMGLIEAGKVPLKWKGQGRLVGDGRSPEYDWNGWLYSTELPQVRNPESGLIVSANQQPVSEAYPFYLNWDYPSPWRAMRIQQALKAAPLLTLAECEKLQTDVLDLQASVVVPALLKHLRREQLSAADQELLTLLESWDFRMQPESVQATLYHVWFEQLNNKVWTLKLGARATVAWPRETRMVELIVKTPTSSWFDDPATPARETLTDWSTTSFESATAELRERFGVQMEKWRWGSYRTTQMEHLGKIPGLSLGPWRLGGSGNTVHANRGDRGPVWRMVVELGPEIHGRGIYPGGQSGNPGSRHYDEFVDDWREGRLRDFVFLKNRVNSEEKIIDRIEMVKE